MNLDAIEGAVGAKCTIQPLKKQRLSTSRLLRKWKILGAELSLSPYRVDTADGREYKLLVAGQSNRPALQALLITYAAVAELDCTPRLLWHNDYAILLDFIQGEVPDLREPACATEFGRSLAAIYRLDSDYLPASTVLRTANKYIEDLMSVGLFTSDLADRVRENLSAQLPERCRTSVDYADVQPGNFRWDRSGKLLFVDIGGFQLGRLTGEGFFGHPGASKIPEEQFTTAYKAAGGPDEIFEFRDAIIALSSLRRGSRLAIWASGMKFLQPRQARAFRARAATLVDNLQAFSNATSDPIS
ncbi:MAG: hypothetical protein GKS02_11490 [Alphaproteobacteria bacterium]|nr:hypothetical protein [Alphaproteobacteria bacterium]